MNLRPSRRALRNALIVALVVFIAIQFVPVDLANPPIEHDIDAPPAVAAILRRSCYDCHSHEARLPWYSKVAPASWLLAKDMREGRDELNFSTWNRYDERRRTHKLQEIVEMTAEGEMPLWFYLPLHPSAKLTDADLAVLANWVALVAPEPPRAAGEGGGGKPEGSR